MRFPFLSSSVSLGSASSLLRGFACAALAVSCCAAIAQAQAPSALPAGVDPALAANPKYVQAITEAKEMQRKKQFVFAEDAYKKASKIAAGKDPVALDGLYDAQIAVGSYKDAQKTAEAVIAIARNPGEKSAAESDRGRALYLQAGDKGKPELLQAADAAFKAAIADVPKNAQAHYMDGYVLARLQQMDAAKDQFQQCLSCISPKDPSYTRTQHFAENPALSTAKMAPPLTVVALDGTKFNLDEMGGRVVLIDFWATWCGPCNEELPHMKKIAKEFANEPLVILSVSWDSDEAKWKDFIAKNQMTWMQYRDADHELSRRFDVNAIPHYFTIDSDGVLTAEMLGEGSDVEGKLKKLIARAKAERERTTTASLVAP
jgi:thiol-disulfide isomerase/thioredoxin